MTTTPTDIDGLIERLGDLIVQATKERSHFYVKSVASARSRVRKRAALKAEG